MQLPHGVAIPCLAPTQECTLSKRPMRDLNKFVVLIGSFARGDSNQYSDCDVFRVGCEGMPIDYSALPVINQALVSCIDYDEQTFATLYKGGSLFLYHVFYEGKLIAGEVTLWEELRNGFSVQKDFSAELDEITLVTQFLSDVDIFGGKFLTPLVNAFTELKNACVFFLAHQEKYIFEKHECMQLALRDSVMLSKLLSLKMFYDFSVRGQDLVLPFDPNSWDECKDVLQEVHRLTLEMKNAIN
jgi:hypothetical protein